MTDDDYADLERRAQRCVTHHAACDCGEWMRAKLERENAAMREIVLAVATMDIVHSAHICPGCRRPIRYGSEGRYDRLDHTQECPVTKARALLTNEREATAE